MDHLTFAQLLGNYGEFVGAVGVVVTLGYLAVQIRSNTKAIKGSTFQAIYEDNRAINQEVFANPEAAELVERIMSRGESFTGTEARRVTAFASGMFRNLDNAYYQMTIGNLDGDRFEQAFTRPALYLMQAPAMRDVWESMRDLYSDDFQSRLDDLCREAGDMP
jgi:hypothetical protein